MSSTGVAITNPLVLYRSLIATQKIRPDPAQHRLALHLQKLYDRLIDYEPAIEYSKRLQLLTRAVDSDPTGESTAPTDLHANRFGRRGVWTSLLAQKERRDSVALTRVLTSHDEAMQLQSPKGLMLHGEVGTGKSMLIDLFQDCLPNRKKRRWHFNTFMLDTISRLEKLRRARSLSAGPKAPHDEYSLLLVARDLIETSPILFLDEFQLPDRAASKILSNLMTSFFQLGGVLIATSNRMPEELAKAAGMEFSRPVNRLSRLGWSMSKSEHRRRDDGAGQLGEFAGFLDVLRARCEVWEMEGKKDYRKLEREEESGRRDSVQMSGFESTSASAQGIAGVADTFSIQQEQATPDTVSPTSSSYFPKNYLIQPKTTDQMIEFGESFNALVERATNTQYPIPWEPATLTVYNRPLHVPAQYNGVAFFTFAELCGAVLGPADYVTLASTYHTFIITDVPVMGLLMKSEAKRLITLLDSMYEARCKLMMTAAVGPDDIFFPVRPGGVGAAASADDTSLENDAVYPETYSEIYQDLNSPFRPNISSYSGGASLAEDALEDDPPNRTRREGSSFTDECRLGPGSPDFANIGGLTGEDEKFAVKRAESRIWEMCSRSWWEKASSVPVEEWWRPIPLESRHWERPSSSAVAATAAAATSAASAASSALPPNTKILSEEELEKDRQAALQDMFKHGASPFRTHPDAPPKFAWTHAWGMMTWGKKAGAWGKGVEGLDERDKVKDGEDETEKDGKGKKGEK
ncbi:mitochondrial ATPase (Afg1) [Pyrenophora tritici-repentis Pt-1C-BFP]|uniref:Mitochondrial ATPase (Afg1) n=1 Tax=Pyrenophora tritici-repentis (strain Pt-1C-BFP) TaxID=426418 RepID=B2W1I0_PYRTR|nr:mitochondrial ATPase (Afg1) [Pyrenophora tritici-repentis Pt-1C-BFP]EDU47153.1 mitochondrial ATPase (Afg1) [Pyrenophora tritici-repentis Pt-1C-BFP]